MTREEQIKQLEKYWAENSWWADVTQDYTAADVVRLRDLANDKDSYVNCMGAINAGPAMQRVKFGIKAICLSGWQVAADGNTSETMYPDQSLYAFNSLPAMVKRTGNTFRRADEIQWAKGKNDIDYFVPIVADAEAGFGGVLNAFELMKSMIEAGAAGAHFEDQLASVKKCGPMGGKALVAAQESIQKLIAARLSADTMGIPTIVLPRTDANAANLLTSGFDEKDAPFVTAERTAYNDTCETKYKTKTRGAKKAMPTHTRTTKKHTARHFHNKL